MKKRFAKYYIPKRCTVQFSNERLLETLLEDDGVWDTDDTNGFRHTFTAVYKLVSVKKVKAKK